MIFPAVDEGFLLGGKLVCARRAYCKASLADLALGNSFD